MISAIIVAAGKSTRMKSNTSKSFLPLANKPLLVWTLKAIEESVVDNIIVVTQQNYINKITSLVNEYSISKVSAVICGGKERQDSVYNALKILPDKTQTVVIHDGARPLIKTRLINKAIEELGTFDGSILAVKVIDTLKESNNNIIHKTLDRNRIIAIQTPQVFKKEPLLKSYEKAMEANFYSTDDAALLEHYGYKVKAVEGSYDNIKITTPIDLKLAEIILANSEVNK